MSILLDVKNLKTHFFQKKKVIPAVDGVDFNLKKGETLAVVGESGSGKSVTALSIMRLIPSPGGKIVDGELLFEGENILDLTDDQMYRIRGNEIAMIFQEPMTSLNPVLTIGDQITEVLRVHRRMSKTEAREQAAHMLERVGFARAKQILDDYPHRLSGGMRQRVMIAMAMASNPKLLIADEPTTALDVTIQAQILELLRDISQEFDSSIMLITHDLGVVAELAERVIVMYGGKIQEESPVYELYDEPLHPYTQGLMAATPTVEQTKKRLYSIRGNVPTPDQFIKGCRFAPRCDQAIPECFHTEPELKEVKPGRKIRCLLY